MIDEMIRIHIRKELIRRMNHMEMWDKIYPDEDPITEEEVDEIIKNYEGRLYLDLIKVPTKPTVKTHFAYGNTFSLLINKS